MKSNIEIGKKYDLARQINGAEDERKIVKITWIEDRGEYLYIGYKVDDGSMSFGAFRQYKDNRPIAIKNTLEPVAA